jgi:peroxiredoxin
MIAITGVCFATSPIFAQDAVQPAPAPAQQGQGQGQGGFGQGQGGPRRNALEVQATAEHPLMKIGTEAPDFRLPGTDGKMHSMDEYRKGKLLVVFFESVHCPVSQNYEDRMIALYNKYHPMGIDFVAINPNNPSAVMMSELNYTDLGDSPAEMKIRVKQRNIPWNYLYDGETQAITQKYGAIATPHVFIFDKDRKLQYQGRIDDNQNEDLVKIHDAADAIDELLAGQPVANPNRPAFGCSTKWLEKSVGWQKEQDKISAQPVNLTQASLDDLKSIRANAGPKVAVIHFWNSSDKSLASDFKDLETTWYWYANRPFTYTTVNTDPAANTDKILAYLKSQRAYNTNVQMNPADLKEAQAVFESTWAPKEEFTVVIAPGGKIVYSEKGPVNVQNIRHAVLQTFPDNRSFPGQAKYWAELKWR